MSTDAPATVVTRNCRVGNHSRCLGTAHGPKGLVPCACPVPDCGHGSDTAKARRKDKT